MIREFQRDEVIDLLFVLTALVKQKTYVIPGTLQYDPKPKNVNVLILSHFLSLSVSFSPALPVVRAAVVCWQYYAGRLYDWHLVCLLLLGHLLLLR